MSVWRRWFGGDAKEGEAKEDPKKPGSEGDPKLPAAEGEHTPAPQRAAPSEFERLAQAGDDDGPSIDEAIRLLRKARGTVNEHEAVAHVVKAAAQRDIPEVVAVAAADILAARGDDAGALRLLAGASSAPALVLSADLFAATGQMARAVGTIERVLARQIDAPGARERHARWRAALGGAPERVRRSDEATIVGAGAGQAPFRLLREVARGGAGAVYEAEDDRLGRRVAFKVYHRRGEDRGVLEREARMATTFAGPGVLRVFDADPNEGWLALEWIARGSIRDLLRAGQRDALLPIAPWARSLAAALARVHRRGLVHADVKPANVLLRSPEEVALGDFGIAQTIGDDAIPGSPGYVSPERLAGRPAHPRDDVYGFGRVIEDVLHHLSATQADGAEGWRKIAARCLNPDETRPADADALLMLLP